MGDLVQRAQQRLAKAVDVLYAIAFDTTASYSVRRNAVEELLLRNCARPPSTAAGTPVGPMTGEMRAKLTRLLPSIRRRARRLEPA
jgi:hypothetical protein